MTEEDVIRHIAYMRCNQPVTCVICIGNIAKELKKQPIIDASLIELTAHAMRRGKHKSFKLASIEITYAYDLLCNIVPLVAQRVKNNESI